MLLVKVKICGITNLQDAQAAAEMGADMLGFNFYPKSPRYVEPDAAVQIIDRLSAYVDTVGVFVNADITQIQQMVAEGHLNWAQLHGDETPQYCESLRSLSVRTMKAIRVKDEKDIRRAEDYATDAVLLDAYHPEKYGGTGMTFDWNIVGHIGKRVFLAGGINPYNARAAAELGVYGLDVCSGIESEPGKKDHTKMRKLFESLQEFRS